tara:strand:- start:124 stop:312 length:189 start_codon:yes stop_codon:yes gene_type:complete
MLQLLLRINLRIVHPHRHITIDLHILINHCTIIHIAIIEVDVTQLVAFVEAFLEILLRCGPK